MGGRSGLMLLAAVACGLGAMYGANRLLSRDTKAPAMRDVVVAARDLPVEEVLHAEALKVVQVPVASAPAGAFATAAELEGRWVQIKMLAEEPVVAAKLAPKNAPPGLVSRIPAGMRAMTIEVNEQTGVAGFVLPGHRVDVVQARIDGPSRSKEPTAAETILEDVLVLAAGQVISRPEDKSMVVRTVTLALSPEDVDRVVAAKSRGPLSLALRGLNDHKPSKPAAEEQQPLVVAAAELGPDVVIAGGMVRVDRLAKSKIPADHFPRTEDVVGRRTRHRIAEGEPVVASGLMPREAAVAGPPLEIGPWERAMSILVDEKSGISGAIKVGDRVDVIAADKLSADIILQNALVVELPSRAGMEKKGDQSNQSERDAHARLRLTLAVPIEQVHQLAQAQASATLSLAIRNKDDDGTYVPPFLADSSKGKLVIFHGLAGKSEHFLKSTTRYPEVRIPGRDPGRESPPPGARPRHPLARSGGLRLVRSPAGTRPH